MSELGFPDVVTDYDEAVAAALFYLHREFGGSLDLGPDPGHLKPYVLMDDPTVGEYIVNDISPEPGLRRWAFLHPELGLGEPK